MVYIRNPSQIKNQQLIARQYNISIDEIKTQLSADYKLDTNYKFEHAKFGETHLYEHIPADEFYDKLENVLASQKKAYKVNIALGYTLYDPVNDETFYFYPNIANTNVYDHPFTINKRSDAQKIITDIRTRDLSESLNYPKSGVKLKAITACKIFIDYRDHALGDSDALVPDFIKKSKYIVNFTKTNSKCVFHCLAYRSSNKKDSRKIQSAVKDCFKQYCEYKNVEYSLSLYRSFKPIDLYEFDQLEECFKCNINVYGLDVETNVVECIRPTSSRYEDTLDILSHDNHAFYITDVNKVQQKYVCSTCEMAFHDSERRDRHKRTKCDRINIDSFPKEPKMYRPNPNLIQSMLRKYGVKDADHYIDHFIVFDLEAILAPQSDKRGSSTEYYNEHIPVSASVSDSLIREVKCFVNSYPKQLVVDMMDYIKSVRDQIFEYNVTKFKKIIITLMDSLGLGLIPGEVITETFFSNDLDRWIKPGQFSNLAEFVDANVELFINKDGQRLLNILKQVPVLGYNSGSYDINLIRTDLFEILGGADKMRVIKNGGYMALSTSSYKFLDIINYLPAGASLDGYLTTYIGGCKCEDKIRCTCGLTKGVFPYEYITSFEVLNETALPPKSAFYSSLRKTNISDKAYQRLQFVWQHYGMKSIKDPIHISIAIHQLAKLRMLEFYYDCVDKYIDRSNFEYQEMDTDSGHIAFSAENPFSDLIKPELLRGE